MGVAHGWITTGSGINVTAAVEKYDINFVATMLSMYIIKVACSRTRDTSRILVRYGTQLNDHWIRCQCTRCGKHVVNVSLGNEMVDSPSEKVQPIRVRCQQRRLLGATTPSLMVKWSCTAAKGVCSTNTVSICGTMKS